MEDDPLAFMRGEVMPETAPGGHAPGGFHIVVTLFSDEDGKASVASRELIGKAAELNGSLGGRVSGCVVSKNAGEDAKGFTHFGLEKLLSCPADNCMAAADKLGRWAESARPWLWLMPDVPHGRMVGARLAMRLDTGLITGVSALELNVSDETVECTHSELNGKMNRTLVMRKARPQIITLAAGASRALEPDAAEATAIEEIT